jgi:mannose-1-phosphate guanylyltransferase
MFIVIMAGGTGTRFWPASRKCLPKQFLKIAGSRTMLEDTLERVKHVASSPAATYVVVNRLHQELTESLVGSAGCLVLAEPVGRNTAACIGLAAMHIRLIDQDEPIIVLPSDHFIGKPDEFAALLRSAGQAARRGSIVTIGATPTRPETGYGYIELGEKTTELGDRQCFRVKRFVEKPDLQTAAGYISSGTFLWNCGVFAFTARTILGEIRSCKPDLFAGLERIAGAIGAPDYQAVLEQTYPSLESISIDYAVMEKTRVPLLVFPGDFGWSDVGSWQAVYELPGSACDDSHNRISGDVVAVDSQANLVHSTTDRLVALLGVEGLVVIDTADALLVARLDRSQDVKQLPELLARKKRDGLC